MAHIENNQGIYGILNTINNKYYIGSTVNFKKRKKQHLKRLELKKHHSYLLQKEWNDNNFVFIFLEYVDDSKDLLIREQWWIDNTDSYYNICKIAKSSLGVKRTDETKNKVRIYNLGLKHPEWRNEIKSKSQSGDNHWTKKKKFSIESKTKMSNSQKELHKNGYISPVMKSILQYSLDMTFIKRWNSLTEAANDININKSTICSCLKNKLKTAGGFIWKYENT